MGKIQGRVEFWREGSEWRMYVYGPKWIIDEIGKLTLGRRRLRVNNYGGDTSGREPSVMFLVVEELQL